jgi:hypothetical protein
MIINQKRTTGSARLRRLLCCFLIVAASIAVVGAIESSRDAVRTESDSAEDDARRMDILAVAGPTPTPLACRPCESLVGLYENFDVVTPPGLPPGWVATNAQGPPPLWVTSNSGVPLPPADTPPNAAFVDDSAELSDKRLDLLGLTILETGLVRLTFRHNFNLEASEQNQSVGYDGGVLELSSDGGNTFQDVLAAGGSFVVGGYNRTIATDRGSPIAGRQAWSGNSGGFITTVVDVPAFQTPSAEVRWRMATDSTGSGEGWRVDSFNITWCRFDGPPCGTPTPTPTARPRSTPTARPRTTPAPRPTPQTLP